MIVLGHKRAMELRSGDIVQVQERWWRVTATETSQHQYTTLKLHRPDTDGSAWVLTMDPMWMHDPVPAQIEVKQGGGGGLAIGVSVPP